MNTRNYNGSKETYENRATASDSSSKVGDHHKFSRLGEPLQQLRIQKKNTKSLIALLLFKIIIYYENILPLRKRSTNDWMLVSIRQSKIV